MRVGWFHRLLGWISPTLLIAGAPHAAFGAGVPPLAGDLQSLCLQSHLDPALFAQLADHAPGVTRAPGASASEDRVQVWGQRLSDRGVLISFAKLGGGGKAVHAMCRLDDLHDGRATLAWLSQWTGTPVPATPLAKYYLIVGPGRPRLVADPGSKSWPVGKRGEEVYVLRVGSVGDDTNLALIK